jgi:biopolymer transport protein ExbD
MKRRRLQKSRPKGVEMPITPMLDLTFQLLFFFIINYNPNALEGQMNLSLPAPVENKAKVEPKDPTPAGNDEELPAQVTIRIRTFHGADDKENVGKISRVSVQVATGGESTIETPNGNLDDLRRHLEKIREDVDNKTAVRLEPEGKLSFGSTMKILDVCRKAGFTDPGFGSPADMGGG